MTVRSLGWIPALTLALALVAGCGEQSSGDSQPSRDGFFVSKVQLKNPSLINDIWV